MKLLRSAVLAAATVSLMGVAKAADFQVAGANISIYGVAHVSADYIDNGSDTDLKVASNSSRIGIKASKKFLENFTVLAQYEVGVDLTGTGRDDGNGGDYDNNAALFTSARDSFIGIAGPFGMVVAGNLPAINQWMYDYNLFADQVGDLGNIWGKASAIGIDRASDTIAYFIPNVIPGLSGDIAYVSDLSGNNNGNKLTAYLIKLNYKYEGFKVGVGYVKAKNETVTPTVEPSDLAITASYTYNNFSIGGGYVHSDRDTATNSTVNSYTIGASYKINGITLKAQYAAAKDDAPDADASQIAVGVDYAVAKNVTVYAAFAKTTNDANANYLANDYGHGKSAYGAPANGDDPSAFSVGLVYKF